MKPGKGWSTWKPPLAALLLGIALGGCATDRAKVEKNLMSEGALARRNDGVSEHYLVGCPDQLEIRLPDRPEIAGTYRVRADGRIDLGDYGRPRVAGQPLMEIARLLAAETGAAPERVHVRVTEFRSQYVLLFGEVIGWQRTVPFEGQETVLDLLQRVGGITAGAEPTDVYVVRTRLEDSQRPEVFHVDLHAIVMKHDEKTNVRILPFDQVYVGETRQAHVEKLFPPWLRPVYQALWRTRPRPTPSDTASAPVRARWIAGPRLGSAIEEGALTKEQ